MFGKSAYIQNQTFDETANRFIEEHLQDSKRKSIFIKPQRARELSSANSLVIICDVNSSEMIENPQALEDVLAENAFIIDHHRIPNIKNLRNFANIHIEPTVSSTSEVVVEMLALKRVKGLRPIAYQLLLNGIYVDTNRFQVNTSPRTFQALSYLRRNGARLEDAVEFFKIDASTSEVVDKLLANLEEVKPGFFLAFSEIECQPDVISIAADKVLEIKGRVASFVIGRIANTNTLKLSARGIKVNVQLICEAVGGGGHFSKAAATFSRKDLTSFLDDLKLAIVSTRFNKDN